MQQPCKKDLKALGKRLNFLSTGVNETAIEIDDQIYKRKQI